MGLFLGDSEPSKIFVWDTEVSKVFVWDTLVRPELPYLCFTALQDNSTVQLSKNWSPTSVTLETSTNWSTWSDYTFWTVITLANVGDKVFFRNKSETPTGFSTRSSNYYKFVMSWKIAASWDVNFLLCKESTDTITSDYCFEMLFSGCTSLTTAPELSATTLRQYCYDQMFYWCTALVSAPVVLPATNLIWNCYRYMFRNCTSLKTAPSISATTSNTQGSHCSWMFYGCSSLTYLPRLYITTMRASIYNEMFRNCSSLKLSATQTWDYTQPYRIPDSWTWTTASSWNAYMFSGTWWTWAAPPTIDTTYYVHKDNTIV